MGSRKEEKEGKQLPLNEVSENFTHPFHIHSIGHNLILLPGLPAKRLSSVDSYECQEGEKKITEDKATWTNIYQFSTSVSDKNSHFINVSSFLCG